MASKLPLTATDCARLAHAPEGRQGVKAISLFTGLGGLDHGFEAAGYQTAAAVELDKDCLKQLALTNWKVMGCDATQLHTDDLLSAAGLRIGEADVLIGGPPCQPFSKSGYWARGDAARLSDPRAGTLDAYLRILEATKPKAFLLENVPGLAFRKNRRGLNIFWTL